jgi:signal transduction histidine kinase
LPEEARHLSRGAVCSERLMRLVDDLLKLSRLGRQTLEYRPVRLDVLAREIVAELSRGAGSRLVDWQVEPLPEVECDPGLMRQVLTNLLSNALKYSTGREPAVIRFGLREREGERVFFVADNGVGFNMRYAEKLFQPFSRLHSAEQFEGTGVGLATVERILRKHGGQIWAGRGRQRGDFLLHSRVPPERGGASAGRSPRGSVGLGALI